MKTKLCCPTGNTGRNRKIMTKYNLTKENLENIIQEANVVHTAKYFNVSTMSVFGGETETETVKADGDIIIAISGDETKFVNIMYYVDGNLVGISAEIDDIYGVSEDDGRLTISIVTYDNTYCDIVFEKC